MTRSARAEDSAKQVSVEDFSRLLRRLGEDPEKLAQESSQICNGGESLLRLIVREIDETILPRQMTLFSGGRPVAMLQMSNRRLLSMTTEETFAAPELPADATPETAAKAFAQAILALGDKARDVTFKYTGRAVQAAERGTRCSATSLASFGEALGRANRLQLLFDQIKGCAKAWIWKPDAKTATLRHGPENWLPAMEGIAPNHADDTVRNGARKMRPGGATPSCAVLWFTPDTRLLIAQDADGYLLAVAQHEDLAALLNTWRKIFGT